MKFIQLIIPRVHSVTNNDDKPYLVYTMESCKKTTTYGVKTSTIVTMKKFKYALRLVYPVL